MIEFELGFIEGLIHLGIFVSGAVAVAVSALWLLERVAGSDKQTIRGAIVLVAAAVFFLFFAAERLYHLFWH